MRLRRPRKHDDMESSRALAEAEEQLQKIKDRDAEVKETGRNLRLLREHNHFSEQLGIIMGGR